MKTLKQSYPLFWAALWMLITAVLPAQASVTITCTSSSDFYIDAGLGGQYVAYRIYNSGTTDYADIWVEITNFTGGVVSLAAAEESLYRIGDLPAGNTETAFFYLYASGATTTPQGHTINVYASEPPGTPESGGTATFSFTTVTATISALANKVNTVVTGPNPPVLGGIVTITVDGDTGVIGSAKVLSFSPATYPNWSSDALELYHTHIVLTGGNNTSFDDVLYYITPATADTHYVATYYLRAIGTTASSTTVSPVANISSGAVLKHTSTTNFGSFLPILPADNATRLTVSVSPSNLPTGGTGTYTITFYNLTTTADAILDDVREVLPTLPDTTTYVPGTSFFNGASIADPAINGANLAWDGPFTIPAGGSRTLVYDVVFPATTGTYTDQVIAHIGNEQIDFTVSTTDDQPATCDLYVGAPPSPTSTATPTYTGTATSTLTASPTASPTPSATPSATLSYTATASPTASPTATPSRTTTISPSATPTATPSNTSTASPTVTPSATSSVTATETPYYSATPTATVSHTASPTRTATSSATASDTPTLTSTPTMSPTMTPSHTGTPTPTVTMTASATPTTTPSTTPTSSPTASASTTPTVTGSSTGTITPTPTCSNTGTYTPSPTTSPTATATETGTGTPIHTATATFSCTSTRTASASPTRTYTPTPIAQTDTDHDGIPDDIDIDDDNDGITDELEDDGDVDTDHDGIPDSLDLDSDNDGIPDAQEGHDFNQDGKADFTPSGRDEDHDGWDDAYKPTGDSRTIDTDHDSKPNWRDVDDDNDGIPTTLEDLDHDQDPSNDDVNHNGVPDYLEGNLINRPLSVKPIGQGGGYAMPNPFFPSRGQKTTFAFALSQSSPGYTISLFSLTNRPVRTLRNTPEWDGKDNQGQLCESGVYLFQIEQGDAHCSGTVVLLAK